jgi:MFS transporter, AAHS family, 3-hydroxyphenylpropionic acid transporter
MNKSIAIALCMAVAVLEGFDIQAMGVAAPRLAPEFGLGAREMGWVFSINNIGMVLGAALGGWLADRVGRKPVFLGAVAMFGVFTLGVVFTRDYPSLLTVRVLAGLGFGAALPNMMAFATELSDPARRSATAALIFCGFPLGGGTVALLTQVLPSNLDWRALFVVGGLLPALLVPILYRFLPETLTPELRGVQKARAPVFKALFGEGRAVPSLLLWLTFLPTLLILYLILNWLPTLVVAKGLDKAIAPQASLAFNLGSVAGALLLGRLVDRFGPRWPMALSYAALIGTLMMLGSSTELAMIITLSGIAGFFLLGANYALYGVAPAYYPTAMRGTGSGASVAVGRVGSILGPAVAGVLLAGGTTATNLVQYLAPVAAVAGIAVFALSFFRREH